MFLCNIVGLMLYQIKAKSIFNFWLKNNIAIRFVLNINSRRKIYCIHRPLIHPKSFSHTFNARLTCQKAWHSLDGPGKNRSTTIMSWTNL